MTRTKALLVTLMFLVCSAGFADWRVLDLSQSVARDQRSTTRALCSFRDDLQKRVTSSREFLRTHPKGVLGIPAGTIRVGIDNQQHTLTALKPLVCPTS